MVIFLIFFLIVGLIMLNVEKIHYDNRRTKNSPIREIRAIWSRMECSNLKGNVAYQIASDALDELVIKRMRRAITREELLGNERLLNYLDDNVVMRKNSPAVSEYLNKRLKEFD